MANRRYPFDEMDRMFDQMRRSMLGNFGGIGNWGDRDFEMPQFGRGADDFHGRGMHSDMNLSLDTDESGYVVLADMPGFEKEEIDLRFDDGRLFISARHEVSESGEDSMSMRSRHVHESIGISAEVREDEITASYRNGVLEVHLPTVEDVEESGTSIDID
ncbi:Hsp20/alpha crystallin family protein [Halomarina litorea]|uniref:Hsp20/alpha crystallin family protein n=1 Tax=Halomarina litorea TaxID=2961595 RepID=UPI0020C37C01|nr:Hsp20/alpha crystallin family protein [Halomarina sp. BCD28]